MGFQMSRVVKFVMKNEKKKIQQKLPKFAQILGILNSAFKPNLAQKSSIKSIQCTAFPHSPIWKRNLDP